MYTINVFKFSFTRPLFEDRRRSISMVQSICIMTRGEMYGELKPEHEGNPEGGAGWISRGLRLNFTVYSDLSHNTDILNF